MQLGGGRIGTAEVKGEQPVCHPDRPPVTQPLGKRHELVTQLADVGRAPVGPGGEMDRVADRREDERKERFALGPQVAQFRAKASASSAQPGAASFVVQFDEAQAAAARTRATSAVLAGSDAASDATSSRTAVSARPSESTASDPAERGIQYGISETQSWQAVSTSSSKAHSSAARTLSASASNRASQPTMSGPWSLGSASRTRARKNARCAPRVSPISPPATRRAVAYWRMVSSIR